MGMIVARPDRVKAGRPAAPELGNHSKKISTDNRGPSSPGG
jgi:hypothetical protein